MCHGGLSLCGANCMCLGASVVAEDTATFVGIQLKAIDIDYSRLYGARVFVSTPFLSEHPYWFILPRDIPVPWSEAPATTTNI